MNMESEPEDRDVWPIQLKPVPEVSFSVRQLVLPFLVFVFCEHTPHDTEDSNCVRSSCFSELGCGSGRTWNR